MRKALLVFVVLVVVAILGGHAMSLQEAAPAAPASTEPAAVAATEPAPEPAEAKLGDVHASGMACDECHTSKTPEPGKAELKPCTRPKSDANGHSDAEAPDVILVDKLSQIYVGVVFPHKLHAEMTEMAGGCETCHHRNPEGPIKPCGACHGGPSNPENLNQPGLKGAYHRQCLGCHREWTHETDCVVCHAKREPGQPPAVAPDPGDIMGRLHPNIEVPEVRVYETKDTGDTPVVTFHHKQHVDLFGLKCTACHAKESCSRCHDEANHKPHVRQDPHEDCMRCHEKEIGDNCNYCHAEKPTEGFNHERVAGHALEPFHQSVQCRKCHGGEVRMEPVAKTECAECHAADWTPKAFDHASTGHPLDDLHVSLECKDCHTQGLGKPVSCAGCHDDDRRTFDKKPAPEPPADQSAQG